MENLVLDSKEIMYLCALLGANEVYGIDDGFAFVSKDKLSQAVSETADSLMRKGYLEMDFDGNNTVQSDTSDIIKIIAHSQNHLILHSICGGLRKNPCIFYRSGDGIVKSEFKNNTFEVAKITAEGMKLEICSRFSESSPQNSNESYRVHGDVFENARELTVVGKSEEAAKLLCENGIGSRSAELIVKGYKQKSDFVSAVVSCTVKRQESTDGMVTLSDENIVLDIAPNLIGEEEYTDISVVTLEAQKARLSDMLIKYGFQG